LIFYFIVPATTLKYRDHKRKFPRIRKKEKVTKDLVKIIERGIAKVHEQLFKTSGGTPWGAEPLSSSKSNEALYFSMIVTKSSPGPDPKGYIHLMKSAKITYILSIRRKLALEIHNQKVFKLFFLRSTYLKKLLESRLIGSLMQLQ
jgi:hypothetical protein